MNFKLYPVYGTELSPIRIKDDPKTYYKFLTAQLVSLKEIRYMSKHGLVEST